ncbi:MAG: tetratricopeptide repeat protein [Pseudomonas sp.]
MPLFVGIAAVLAIAALGSVLWPLRRQSRGLVLAGVALLGVAGFALYRIVGTPAALDAAPQAGAPPHDLDEAIAQLREALRRDPGQLEGWLLLGRSLASQQRFAEARDAFAQALRLAPDQPDVLVAAAQSRMLAAPEQHLDAGAVALLEHALALQPDNQRARWFLGVAQRQAGQPAQAARTWQPLLSEVDADTRASLLEQVNLARREAGEPPLDATIPARAGLVVKVRLDPGLAARARLSGNASVFVIARAPDGPPMPVAVEKHALQELPLTVTLDDGDSPMPTMKLSALDEVEVLARLSASGNATRQAGDLESAPVRLKLPASAPVELVIGAAHP